MRVQVTFSGCMFLLRPNHGDFKAFWFVELLVEVVDYGMVAFVHGKLLHSLHQILYIYR